MKSRLRNELIAIYAPIILLILAISFFPIEALRIVGYLHRTQFRISAPVS